MNKIKVVKVDPLELSSSMTWRITGLLKISLKDFVVFVDDKSDIMYVNASKKIPKKDIDGFIDVITFPHYWIGDYEEGKGEFLDYVCKQYGWAAYMALHNSHAHRMKEALKKQAEQLAETIAPAIEEELQRITPNEMLLYYIREKSDKVNKKTFYNMVGYNCIYDFMLGYLAGAGKISAEGVISVHEEESEV